MEHELISRQDALAQGLRHYFTGLSCNRGHIAQRLASTRACCACRRVESMTAEQLERKRARDRVENMSPEQVERNRARQRDLSAEQRERYNAAQRVENMTPEKVERRNAAERIENLSPEQAERRRARFRKGMRKEGMSAEVWARHLAQLRARLIKRKLHEKQATPSWANPEAIRAIYAEADRLTRETGEPWHVDHVVPLQGKTVCGLHVEANLRVMPGTENMKKGNRNWPGSNGWLLPPGALPATPAAAAGIACWERDSRGRAAPWVAVPRDRPL